MSRNYRLSTEQVIQGMRMSFDNARRLADFSDPSRVQNKDIPAAVPLAILALEEIGKLIRIFHASRLTVQSKKGWEGFKMTFYKHPSKQVYAQSPLFSHFVRSFTDLAIRLPDSPDRATYYRQINKDIRRERANVRRLGKLGFPSPYYTGKNRRLDLEQFKREYLYVDMEPYKDNAGNERVRSFIEAAGAYENSKILGRTLLELSTIRVDACVHVGLKSILDHWKQRVSLGNESKVREEINRLARKLGPTRKLAADYSTGRHRPRKI